MSLELVLLVPVLVLLTVFVLWAGRGGQVALTADLAAEEAATAAALCCEEDSGGSAGREALVEDVLEARPGLGFLCIGGPRPDAGVGSDGFLSEHWLEFEPGRDTGGVGVLGVQFLCETDGAVAPLRGLFPTVTFHGQASEVVLREPRFIVGFDPTPRRGRRGRRRRTGVHRCCRAGVGRGGDADLQARSGCYDRGVRGLRGAWLR